ncbi:MAG: hypothetical protein KDA32_01125 [Phycisphaerales bacterium]|nr:hypothetical protein [Phycisphaerales bacterium]
MKTQGDKRQRKPRSQTLPPPDREIVTRVDWSRLGQRVLAEGMRRAVTEIEASTAPILGEQA